MSEFLVGLFRFAYLALLWLFILISGNIIKTDLFGRKVPVQKTPEPKAEPKAPKVRGKTPRVLRITEGKQAGLVLDLGAELIIGRSSDCQLILDDDYVSTRHARLYLDGRNYAIADLGSTNGTYVNNERIAAPTQVGLSDTIRIGRTQMSLEK